MVSNYAQILRQTCFNTSSMNNASVCESRLIPPTNTRKCPYMQEKSLKCISRQKRRVLEL